MSFSDFKNEDDFVKYCKGFRHSFCDICFLQEHCITIAPMVFTGKYTTYPDHRKERYRLLLKKFRKEKLRKLLT